MQRSKLFWKKFLIVLVSWLFIFSGLWISLAFKYIKFNNFYDEALIFISNNYNSCTILVGVLTLPFLCSLYFLFESNQSCKLVRYKARDNYILKNLFYGIEFSIAFALIHGMVNLIGLKLSFNSDMFATVNLYEYCIINAIVMAAYYARCSNMYTLAISVIDRKYAIIWLTTLYFLSSVIIKMNFPQIWLPCDDVTIFMRLLSCDVDAFNICLIITREIVLGIGFGVAALLVFNKKDVVTYDK